MKKKKKITIYIILILLALFITYLSFKTPLNNRDWNEDQMVLSSAVFEENLIHINNVRNISYKSTTDYNVSYYNKTVNIDNLIGLDYLIEKFSSIGGIAHTLFNFRFNDNTSIAISVEIRKEKGEQYSIIKGLLREYELMYVVADPQDVINLRTKYRNSTVYSYPLNISKDGLDGLFIGMLEKANQLKKKPEFYNTFKSTCTTNLAEQSSDTTNEKFFKYHPYILLPGYSDKIILYRSLIKTNLTTIQEVREKFQIN